MYEIKKSYDLKKKTKKTWRSKEPKVIWRGNLMPWALQTYWFHSKSQLRGPMGKVKNTGSAVTLNTALTFKSSL